MTYRAPNFMLIFLLFFGMIAACSRREKPIEESRSKPLGTTKIPRFNSDSAYFFIKKQVDFGPRIPNTIAHLKTGNYLISTLKKYGASVVVQEFESINYSGKKLRLKNIVASFNPTKNKKILLAAHWDTRPFADKDKENASALFDGANDGASGVGVLLEVARLMQVDTLPQVGIDIILFDGEDWGERNDEPKAHPLPAGLQDWWCLGSQYWSKHKHVQNYSAYYGILLDMVGAKGAKFYREEKSLTYAPSIVEKIWNAAATQGYASYFVKQNMGAITDDHCFVNGAGKIPMVDIIHFEPHKANFPDFHHTHKDNMQIISKETLQAVGETVLYVVYSEE